MGRFNEFHPACSFFFFMAVIFLTVILNNPVYMIISFISAFLFKLILSGKTAFSSLKLIIPVIIFAGLFNMLFTHYGVTRLFSVGAYDFMLESLAYGFSIGVMLSAVMIWFACYTSVVTSEKFIALFGGFMPNMALLFSMVLRFIPLMIKTSKEIKDANIGMGKGVRGLKNSINRFSCLVSISLEKSIETADAMKCRGFGSNKRKPYIKYRFRLSDGIMLLIFAVLFGLIIVSDIMKINMFSFEPKMTFDNDFFMLYILFGILMLMPVIIYTAGEIKWHFLKLKI